MSEYALALFAQIAQVHFRISKIVKLFRKQKYSKALFSVFAQNEFYYSSFIESMSHLQEPTHNYEKQFQR